MGSPLSGDPFAPVAGDLAHFEVAVRDAIASDGDLLASSMGPLFEAGGKRLRPSLVFLAGRLAEPGNAHLNAAIAVELMHAATLVHDDLIDRAELRRGKPTIAHLLGPAAAIVIGDFYFAKAYHHAALTGDAGVVGRIARAVMSISAGELAQDRSRYRYAVSIEEYSARIEAKTATLLAASCWVGGRLAGLSPEQLDGLHHYGIELGLAFQIVDDVLDYTAGTEMVGKPVGHDLCEGYATLPLLLTTSREALVDGTPLTADEAVRVVGQVRAGEGIELSLTTARRHAQAARECLVTLPAGAARDSLAELTEFVVERGS